MKSIFSLLENNRLSVVYNIFSDFISSVRRHVVHKNCVLFCQLHQFFVNLEGGKKIRIFVCIFFFFFCFFPSKQQSKKEKRKRGKKKKKKKKKIYLPPLPG